MANGNVHSRMLFYRGLDAEKRDDDNYREGVSLSFPILSAGGVPCLVVHRPGCAAFGVVSGLIVAKSSSTRIVGERACKNQASRCLEFLEELIQDVAADAGSDACADAETCVDVVSPGKPPLWPEGVAFVPRRHNSGISGRIQ